MYDFMLSVPFGDKVAMDYYGGINEAYETDLKKVQRSRQDVSVLLGEISPVSDEELILALAYAFSGRLSFEEGYGFEYTAGQFYNIEVPQAVCEVLETVKRNRKHQSESGMCICGCHDIITRPHGCEECKDNHTK